MRSRTSGHCHAQLGHKIHATQSSEELKALWCDSRSDKGKTLSGNSPIPTHSEEKKHDRGSEASRLLNSYLGSRAITAMAGTRVGMQVAVRILKEQQEDLEKLLYKYDNSFMRSVSVINRTSASARRRAVETPTEGSRNMFEERRLEASRLRRTCVSVDSAKHAEDEDALCKTKGGIFKDRPGLSPEVNLFPERPRWRGSVLLSKPLTGASRQHTPVRDRPADAASLRIDARAIPTSPAPPEWDGSDADSMSRVARAGRAIEHEERPPEVEKRPPPENRSKLIEDLQRQEAERHVDPEWRKKAKVIFDAAKRVSAVGGGIPVFSSNFESGNLKRVTQVGAFEFDLQLCPDTNTCRHMQWFYFKMAGMRPGVPYKLNIVNLCKRESLYNHGLRPLTYSEKRVLIHGVGWARGCDHIAYYKSTIHYRGRGRLPFHTLTFRYTPEYDNDAVYFAHCYPYTTKQLQRDLATLEADQARRRVTSRAVLCLTPAGLDCPVLTVTSPTDSPRSEPKTGIFICARAHPGESPASYMMKGVLEFLTGPDERAAWLRSRHVFKIVPVLSRSLPEPNAQGTRLNSPRAVKGLKTWDMHHYEMLNPDGVVSGNTRSTLHGEDLNRHWRSPHKMKHSTVCAARELLDGFARERRVVLNLDLHAHSRRCNVFAYGCVGKIRPAAAAAGAHRVFPALAAEACEAFDYRSCTYKTRGKEETERVVLHREYNVGASYTIEASFLGGNFGRFADMHYTSADYVRFGRNLCAAVHAFSSRSEAANAAGVHVGENEGAAADEASSDSEEDTDDPSDFSSEGDDADFAFETLSTTPRPPAREFQDTEPMRREPDRPKESARPKEPARRLATASRPSSRIGTADSPGAGLGEGRAEGKGRRRGLRLKTGDMDPTTSSSAAVTPSTPPPARPAKPERRLVPLSSSPAPEPRSPVAPPEPTAEPAQEEQSAAPVREPVSPEIPHAPTPASQPALESISAVARVLLRVHAIKTQMAGVRGELSALQSRVTRYDGFTKGIVDRIDQQAAEAALEK